MPVRQSSKKGMRTAERKRVINRRRRNAMKEAVKEIRDLVDAGKTKEAEKKLPDAYKAIDKAAKHNIIKKNTAARKKSKLSRLVSEK